jgi:hypothetical protein
MTPLTRGRPAPAAAVVRAQGVALITNYVVIALVFMYKN